MHAVRGIHDKSGIDNTHTMDFIRGEHDMMNALCIFDITHFTCITHVVDSKHTTHSANVARMAYVTYMPDVKWLHVTCNVMI